MGERRKPNIVGLYHAGQIQKKKKKKKKIYFKSILGSMDTHLDINNCWIKSSQYLISTVDDERMHTCTRIHYVGLYYIALQARIQDFLKGGWCARGGDRPCRRKITIWTHFQLEGGGWSPLPPPPPPLDPPLALGSEESIDLWSVRFAHSPPGGSSDGSLVPWPRLRSKSPPGVARPAPRSGHVGRG